MLIGPAGIPQPVAQMLNGALNAALRNPQIRERMISAGHYPPGGPNTLESTRVFMTQELEAMQQMVERTGIRLQP